MPAKKSSRSVPPGAVRVPPRRRTGAQAVARLFKKGQRVAITTHVNADGDGCGSEVALWHMLTALRARPVIVNPTPFPDRYRFLLDGMAYADKSREAVRHLERADVIVVLDIADLGRLGHLGRIVGETERPVVCVDHHASDGTLPPGPRLVDETACATGELIYDLARIVHWQLSEAAARALYVAILTDTGGFRFSNTTARTLQLAAHLLEHGFQPEDVYTRVYASEPEGRIRMMAEVLETLVVEREHGIAWVTVPPGSLERHDLDPADLEGVVEFPRSIRGVRLAMLFRVLANGRIKVSFRSVGDVDVSRLAERFGGGGHRRAAGASLEGTLASVQETVLQVARDTVGGREAQAFILHPLPTP